MIRIAFTVVGGKNWVGGYNYLLNLLRVITIFRPDALQPVLFLGTDVTSSDAHPFQTIKGLQIVRSPLMSERRRTMSLCRSLMFGVDSAIRQLFKENRIDVVFESSHFYGVRLGIPTIAWIPDFQHRELPKLFSHVAWWKRELGFRAQIASDRTIMVSSQDARNSCERYYPKAVGRTHVVRFAIPPREKLDPITVRLVRRTYHLPERYFYLPNQFWQHKNHLLVIEALALLKHAGHYVVVVASGKEYDPRRPGYFDYVVNRLVSMGVSDRFRLIGLIPYEHVAPLMVGSLAVLNPSLFEGWSTTVEEARALQVPLILSDLAVHKEQAADFAHFFDRTSAESLASVLLAVWQRERTWQQEDFVCPLTSVEPVRRFADDLVELARRVIGQYR